MGRANGGLMTFACVQMDGEAGCLATIENKQADMRSFDGPDVYRGYVDHNLMVRLLVWVSDGRLSKPGLPLFVPYHIYQVHGGVACSVGGMQHAISPLPHSMPHAGYCCGEEP
jgi:hypothetical protein